MAVVQISRIQHRRGQKNTGTGLPQLASGELGWAIDTRELYIGNGSVSEGAPAVGNTKILTEYDNILDFADTYRYQINNDSIQTGNNTSSPVSRSLQQRLDDFVSVRAFGARGDGVTDDTAAVQRAIDQLFVNPAYTDSPINRYKLRMEPGKYLITDTLYIPPFATVVGAGSYKTMLKFSNTTESLRTVNSLSLPGNPGNDAETNRDNQARHVLLQGLTVENSDTSKGLILQYCRDSVFRDLRLQGNWQAIDGSDFDSVGVELNSLSSAVSADSNSFENCVVTDFAYGMRSNWDVKYNTVNNCRFANAHIGIAFGDDIAQTGASGQTTGPLRNTISHCVFNSVNRQALLIDTGEHNLSQSNSFVEVGNDQGAETEAVSSAIRFGTRTNQSVQDYFSRTAALISGGGLTQTPYIPEISGAGAYEISEQVSVSFGSVENQKIFRLPGVENQLYELDYTLLSPRYFRSGTLTVITDGYNNTIELSDSFDHVGSDDYLCDISFSGSLKNLSGSGGLDTIEVKTSSSVPDTDQRTLTFTVRAKNTDTT